DRPPFPQRRGRLPDRFSLTRSARWPRDPGPGRAPDAIISDPPSHRGSWLSEVDVRLQRVTKRFGDVTAVDDLSLDIDRGEFFSLLGPSGCGKTTTLRILGGFEDATSGAVELAGRDVTDLPPHR